MRPAMRRVTRSLFSSMPSRLMPSAPSRCFSSPTDIDERSSGGGGGVGGGGGGCGGVSTAALAAVRCRLRDAFAVAIAAASAFCFETYSSSDSQHRQAGQPHSGQLGISTAR
eukprot:scaffold1510_cov83-Phaeocystis_antarctica.AAC.1